MRSSFLRGFSLAEVLVAMLVASLVLVAGLVTLEPYVSQLRWLRLHYQLELQWHQLQAQSQYQVSFADEVQDSSTQWHLYVDASPEPKWWLFESTLQENGMRQVLHQEFVSPEVFPIRLQDLQVVDGDETYAVEQVLVTWEGSPLQVQFSIFPDSLLQEEILQPEFDLSAASRSCSACALELVFREGREGREKVIRLE